MNGAYVAIFCSLVAVYCSLIAVFVAKKKRGERK
jgi:hypothetical protein